jgi:hypothetical protein
VTEGDGERLPDDEVSDLGSDERRAKSQVMSEVRRMLYIRMKSVEILIHLIHYSWISSVITWAGQVPHLNQKDHTPALFAQSALR